MGIINIIKERYENFYPSDGIDKLVLHNIEKKLNVKLPEDFQRIAEFYSGGLLGEISMFAFDSNPPNLVDETLRLRNVINLPKHFLVLAEPPASLIVMDTVNKPAVIWLDNSDVDKLHNTSLLTSPDIWNTFSEFFMSLIEQEEEGKL
ncbi:SMI1/KNR4 family protein [Metabacillus fastidiosus]|uniref:SMI1/KNR4 family protein n=1 Tax=Metabacillus fastidiosus TaxID=1458 RepID=A0ABU6P0Q3_9BACI|nr:SMI1/KNR4 family protein [Metabacillus fastidiosus]MED4402568.1 SMI1/KNR4 family protein [Metabacillus fastidiosus]MED4461928.1 SMI1/KNR4 family protein [Metabacillus fastidiosus]